MNKMLYLIVASAFIGVSLFSIDIKIMQFSLYRLSLFIMIFYLAINNLLIDKKINIGIKDRQSLIRRFYLFWLIYAAYSLIWVGNLNSGIRDLFFIASGVLCIWIFSTFAIEEKDFKNIFNTIYIMILFHNLLGWFELQTGRYFFADLSKIDRYGQFAYNKSARVPVTLFSNTNDFATLMTFGVFISFIILLNSKKLYIKLLSSFTIVSSILLILKTGSRANMLGVFIGILAIAMLILLRRFKLSVVIVAGIVGLVLIMMYPPLNARLVNIIQNRLLSRFGSNSLSVRSDMTRINLIKNGLNFLLNTVGFGTGVGNIEYWMETRQVFYVGKVFNIHNWWIEILVGYGVVIFIGYISIYFIKVKTLFDAYLKSKESFIRNSSLGLFGFMMAFVISSVSSSSNINTEWMWLFWAVLIAFIGYIVREFKADKNLKREDVLEIK